jgi:hypothetical protein
MRAAIVCGMRAQNLGKLDVRAFPEQIEIVFSESSAEGWHD